MVRREAALALPHVAEKRDGRAITVVVRALGRHDVETSLWLHVRLPFVKYCARVVQSSKIRSELSENGRRFEKHDSSQLQY